MMPVQRLVKANSNHQPDHADWGYDEEYADDAGSRRFVCNGDKIAALIRI
jgi:hypothetical protein